jgi:hypothetical protein
MNNEIVLMYSGCRGGGEVERERRGGKGKERKEGRERKRGKVGQ